MAKAEKFVEGEFVNSVRSYARRMIDTYGKTASLALIVSEILGDPNALSRSLMERQINQEQTQYEVEHPDEMTFPTIRAIFDGTIALLLSLKFSQEIMAEQQVELRELDYLDEADKIGEEKLADDDVLAVIEMLKVARANW